MARRRGHNEGTIYRTEWGTWRAQLTLRNGKRKSKNFKTRREAQEWLLRASQALRQGNLIESDKATVSELLDRWLNEVVAVVNKPKTQHSYNTNCKQPHPP